MYELKDFLTPIAIVIGRGKKKVTKTPTQTKKVRHLNTLQMKHKISSGEWKLRSHNIMQNFAFKKITRTQRLTKSTLQIQISKLDDFTVTFFRISHQALISKTRLNYRNFKYEVLPNSHLNFIQRLRHSVTVQLNKNSWLQRSL